MKKICIFHFSPPELFPPVMNLISYLEKELPKGYIIRVYTTTSNKGLKLYGENSKRIQIKRFGKYDVVLSGFRRLRLYVTYNLLSFLDAFFWRPGKVLYYETFSAIPAIALKKLRPGIQIYIHYHEYMSPNEYNNSGLLKKVHEIEKKNYSKAAWISHTNEDRLQLFVKDTGVANDNRLHTLPNYPSRSWGLISEKKELTSPVRAVYIGAIGLDSLYIGEFAQWVEKQNGNIIWDIYTQQDDQALKIYLKEINSRYVNVKGFVSYERVPEVLMRYDVGVILYKGLSPNFVYNAPNKLFEYLACGLDVWFPQELKGAYPFITHNTYPKVINVSFAEPEKLILEKLIDKKGLTFKPSDYYYEEQYNTLGAELM